MLSHLFILLNLLHSDFVALQRRYTTVSSTCQSTQDACTSSVNTMPVADILTCGRKVLKPRMSSLWPLKSCFTLLITPSVLILHANSRLIICFTAQSKCVTNHTSTRLSPELQAALQGPQCW